MSSINEIARLHRFALAGIVITILALLPTFFLGLVNDDYLFIRVMDLGYYGDDFFERIIRAFAFYPSPAENLTHISLGYSQANWWTNTATEHWFFRPLTALSHYLDYALFPGNLLWMHLHNFLILLLALALLFRFLEELGLSATHKIVVIALILIDSATLWSGWIAQRNAYMALSAMLAALILHIRFLKSGAIPAYIGGITLYILALLSSEAGIVTTVFLFFLPIALNRNLFTREHLVQMAPYALITLAYLILYKQFGFGVHHHPFYTDPFSEPWDSLISLGKKFPFFMLSAAGVIPAESAYAMDFLPTSVVWITTGLLFLAVLSGLGLLWRWITSPFRALFLYGILCGLFALLPLTGSMIADRSGTFLKIGIGIAMGTAIFQWITHSRNSRGKQLLPQALPLFFLLKSLLILTISIGIAFQLSRPDPLLEPLKKLEKTPQHIVYLTVHDVFLSAYLLEKIRFHYDAEVKTAHRIVADHGDITLERVDGETIRLTSLNAPLLHQMDLSMDRITFRTGEQFSSGFMQISIEKAVNGLPWQILVRFSVPVDQILFLSHDSKAGYASMSLPATGGMTILR